VFLFSIVVTNKEEKMAFTKKYFDLKPYKDLETLLAVFRYYGCNPVQVGKNHDEYICHDPFVLEDKTPSIRISSLKKNNIWGFKSFCSGKSGDVFSLIMEMEKVNFMTSIWIVIKKIAPDKKPNFTLRDKRQLELPFPKYQKPHGYIFENDQFVGN
jgi:hypothetical protein